MSPGSCVCGEIVHPTRIEHVACLVVAAAAHGLDVAAPYRSSDPTWSAALDAARLRLAREQAA